MSEPQAPAAGGHDRASPSRGKAGRASASSRLTSWPASISGPPNPDRVERRQLLARDAVCLWDMRRIEQKMRTPDLAHPLWPRPDRIMAPAGTLGGCMRARHAPGATRRTGRPLAAPGKSTQASLVASRSPIPTRVAAEKMKRENLINARPVYSTGTRSRRPTRSGSGAHGSR
jgi:hypothetical protein